MRIYEIIQNFRIDILTESFDRAIREFSKSDTPDNVKDLISKYRHLLTRNEITERNYKDINYWIERGYESFSKFVLLMDGYVTKREEERKALLDKLDGESVHIITNQTCDVYIPVTHSESRRLGQDSNWCTSASSASMWDSYVGKDRHIMVIVVSKNNVQDNYSIRYTRQGRVIETRDLTQKLTHQEAANRMQKQHGITTDSIWETALRHITKVCGFIDDQYKARGQRRSFNEIAEDISADDVDNPDMLYHVMAMIKLTGRGPNEHFDLGEITIITTGFLQYLDNHYMKARIVRLIDTYWKHNVLMWFTNQQIEDRAMWPGYVGPITTETATLIENSGSKVLRNGLRWQYAEPSAEVEQQLLSIKNESKRKSMVYKYCKLHVPTDYILSDELLRVLTPVDIRDMVLSRGLNLLLGIAQRAERVYQFIDDRWVESYLEWYNGDKDATEGVDIYDLYEYYGHRQSLGVDRWPEFEQAVLNNRDVKTAMLFCQYIFNDRRWPEAEPIIMEDPKAAHDYARTVIGKRWPEAEEYIKRDPGEWARYKKNFGVEE